MVQEGSILCNHVLLVTLVVVLAHVLVLFLVPIYASDFAQGGTIGSGAATIPSGTGSGSACTGSIHVFDDSDFVDGGITGSWAVYGRGILVDGGSISGADGSMVDHVGGGQV